MYRVFLGLGSNLGDRHAYLRSAIQEIRQIANVSETSAVYKTEPFGMKSQNEFLNIAVAIETTIAPPDLMRKLKGIEHGLGRTPHSHMKDREIDIDILLYEHLYYEEHSSHSVEVPHPDLLNRKFALTMLNDIASTVVHPILGETIAALLQKCPDRSAVDRTAIQF